MQTNKQLKNQPTVGKRFFTNVPPVGSRRNQIADYEQELYETGKYLTFEEQNLERMK